MEIFLWWSLGSGFIVVAAGFAAGFYSLHMMTRKEDTGDERLADDIPSD